MQINKFNYEKKSIIVIGYKMSDNYEFEKSSRPKDVDGYLCG